MVPIPLCICLCWLSDCVKN